MDWSPVSLFVPPTMRDAHRSTEQSLTDARTEIGQSRTWLNGVAGVLPHSPNQVAAAASDIAPVRAAVEDLLAAGGRFLCVHPYQYPVGDRRGEYAYLTPADAGAHLCCKLADPIDDNSFEAAVVLSFRGVDHQEFSKQLAAFNAVFPVTELQLAERRAKTLHTLEQDKFHTPRGALYPRWRAQNPCRHATGQRMKQHMGALLAVAEAYAQELTRPEQELNALLQRKQMHLETLANAWSALQEHLHAQSGVGLYCEGSAGKLRTLLHQTPPPGAGHKLAALVCWTGTLERVRFFKEVFGL